MQHGNTGAQSTDAQTSDKSTHGKLDPDSRAGDFDNNTNDIEESRGADSESATNLVGQPSTEETSDESTDAKEANDSALASGRELAILAKAVEEVAHGKET